LPIMTKAEFGEDGKEGKHSRRIKLFSEDDY
jgi:hypothetical protein